MQSPVRRSKLHVAFQIGVILKGLDGLLELIGGILLLAFPPSALQRFVVELTHNEITRQAQTFAAIYLLSHGLIKVVLVYALLKNKLWAFPWAMVFSPGSASTRSIAISSNLRDGSLR